MDYPIVIVPLSEEDGGGYLAYFPDLTGCASDGETPQEALANAMDAFEGWMEVARGREGYTIPQPGEFAAKDAEHRRRVLQVIKEYEEALEKMDGVLTNELHELRIRIEALEESMEESDAWRRFQSITGVGKQMALPSI